MRLIEKVDDHKSNLPETYEIRCPACHSTLEFAEKELTHDIINLEIIDSKKYFPCPEITFRRFLSRKFAYPSKVNFYDILSLHCLNCKNLVIVASLNRHDFTYNLKPVFKTSSDSRQLKAAAVGAVKIHIPILSINSWSSAFLPA